MNAQELIKKSALIEKTLQEQGLQERAKPFMSDNSVIKTEELEKTLKELQDTNRDLKVGIIGRVKAGKSSLLNALIFEGVEVLPKATTPMTASLTILKYADTLSAEVEFYSPKDILKYADTLSAEVEFYSPKDIAELENEHERYVREFNKIVDEEVKKQKEKQSLANRAKERFKNLSNKFSRNKSDEAPKERVLSDEEIVKKAERIAKSELEKDTKLVSSYDQYERMKKSGLLNTENLDPHIQADSAVGSMSEVEKSNHHLPTALENAQKSLSSQLNNIMEKLIENYPNQREIFEKAIKNGVILASGVCFSMYKDFENQASWERNQKTEEYHNALRNLRDFYPDAFNSVDKSKESLLFLSNMGTIKERLEKAAQKKEEIISQKLQDYTQSQANNLHLLIAQLLQDLEEEKKRIKSADMGVIKKQIEAYEKLSGNIETGFRDAYEEFILHFINNIRVGLEEALKKAIQTAKTRSREEEEEERYIERVKQGGLGGWARFFGSFFGEKDWGYNEVERTRATIKAGAVLDYLTEMHERCESALNDSANSFKVVFRKELYAKVFKQLREIISDDLIDEVAFQKSVMAVLDRIEFKEFDYTDKLPGEIRGKTGNLKGDEANAFIQSVGNYVRDFEAETKKDVKGYIQGLREALERQNFASDTLKKLQKDMQNLKNQVQNKVQSIAQLDAQIKALKEI
ncbi:dynamin family protein [Helicobacter pylori]|uniref:dynamin family protein n=1 Tax=Helicobacter pylori TaxID=210 RepID=UPI0018A6B9CD|nr:dynamin family protein [Helicobacter pylori]